jgi:hypothetical protein
MNRRKTHRIWYLMLLVVGLFLLILVFPFKSGVERTKWFQYASRYDQAWSKMAASGGALDHYNKMMKMGHKFLRTKQPTETEIISVLRSPNRTFQRIGLAAMSLKPIETGQLADILFEFLHDQDPWFRWYATVSLGEFTTFPESKKADLAKQLLDILVTKSDTEWPIEAISLLGKFPSEEAALFLTKLLMKEGTESRIRLSRYVAFEALKEMGNSFYDQAAEYVNTHGSPEIKKELLRREHSWEEEKTSQPEANKDENIFLPTR